jgi:copper chaperone NosL
MLRRTLLALFLLSALGCAEEPRPRCAWCGMIVAEADGWRARGVGEDGQVLHFDAPKCLFRHRFDRGEVTSPQMVEYYSQELVRAEGLYFVLGSDLRSPMGRDIVPVDGLRNAEQLMEDHHGDRVVRYREVTPSMIRPLFE